MSAVKRVLCMHDLACVGRTGLAVATPIISAMGLQACSLPTELLSTHTYGFGKPEQLRSTTLMNGALAHFAREDIDFDAVYTGYFSSTEQAEAVGRALANRPKAIKVVDPVMADNGKLYSYVTPKILAQIQGLCHHADIITPNKTESAVLLSEMPDDGPLKLDDVIYRLHALQRRFFCMAVITGIDLEDGRFVNACIDREGRETIRAYKPVEGYYPGAGDVFASIITGEMVRGKTLPDAMRTAADFVASALILTNREENKFGLCIEPLLPSLYEEIQF